MKKVLFPLFVAAVALCMCLFAGCGPAADNIEIADSLNLVCGETAALEYTVTPEDAKVNVSVSDEKVLTYSDGKVTALTAGKAVIKVADGRNSEVYAECEVTVAPPQGYTAYATEDYKLVYPSGWEKSTNGVITMFSDKTSENNINISSEKKNNFYWIMTDATYRKALESNFSIMGITVEFKSVKVNVYDYLGSSRVHTSVTYSLAGVEICQEQTIINSGDKTYLLTTTSNISDAKMFETLSEQFVSLK